MENEILSYIDHGDIIISSEVYEKSYLRNFPIEGFLNEIDLLWYEWYDYYSAIWLLNRAREKIFSSGEMANTLECSQEDMLMMIEEKIFEIEDSMESMLGYMDYNFQDNLKVEDRFCYGGEDTNIINVGCWPFIYEVEHILIEKGFFNENGNWIRSERDLAILIDIYNNNGIFKRRDIKGKWYDKDVYIRFFQIRYSPIFSFSELNEAYKNLDYSQSEVNLIFPWIAEHLNNIKG